MTSIAWEEFFKRPFVYLLFSLIFGILSIKIYQIHLPLVLLLSTLVLIRNSRLLVISCILLAFVMGNFSAQKTTLNQNKEINESTFLTGKIEEITVKNEKNRILINVQKCDNKWLEKRKVILSSDEDLDFNVGQIVALSLKLKNFNTPNIPKQFDFRKYYEMRNVVAQGFVNMGSIEIIDQHRDFYYYVGECKEYLESNLDKHISIGKERAVIKALVTGNRDEVDTNLREIYVDAGIFHVLAVSGMHVVILYLILGFFMRFINNNFSKIIITCFFLAFYACLTGLSHSVVRACVMFAFFAFAQFTQQKTNSISTLCNATFCILLVNPSYLYESGFQLSIAAVLGILLFLKPIENLWKPTHWLLNFIWKNMAVTLAAQLSTTPLVLFYFHQFPSYFLIINLIALPLTTLALIFGMICAIFGNITFIGYITGQIAFWCCHVVNLISEKTSNIPFSKLKGFYLSEWQCCIFIFLILCISFFWMYKRRVFLYLGVTFSIFLSITISIRLLETKNQEYLALHVFKNRLIIEKVNGKYSCNYLDTNGLDKFQFKNTMSNYWASRNISIQEIKPLILPISINSSTFVAPWQTNSEFICYQNKYGTMVIKEGDTLLSRTQQKSVFIGD